MANQFRCLRKTFDLATVPGVPTYWRVAAADKYWLWVNGNLAVVEGGLKRGPTPTDHYFDEVDVKDFLQTGTNLISVLLVHFNRESASHNPGRNGSNVPQPAFFLDTKGAGGSSDATWKVLDHPGFETSTGLIATHAELAEENVRFDLGNALGNIDFRDKLDLISGIGQEWIWKATFNDTGWAAATAYGAPTLSTESAPAAPADQWGKLYPRLIPLHAKGTRIPWTTTDVFDATAVAWQGNDLAGYADPGTGVAVAIPYVNSSGGVKEIACKLPDSHHFIPIIGVSGADGLLVDFYTEKRDVNGLDQTTAVVAATQGQIELDSSYQIYEHLHWMQGEYLIIEVPDGTTLQFAGYRQLTYDSVRKGSFSCNDSDLNTIWNKAANTFDACVHDAAMDNPNREQVQAAGESFVIMHGAFYLMEHASISKHSQRMLQVMSGWYGYQSPVISPPNAQHEIQSVWPSGPDDGAITGRGRKAENSSMTLALFGMEGLWNYYLNTGDFQTLDDFYANLKLYIESFTLDGDNLPTPKTYVAGEMGQWVDWYDTQDTTQSVLFAGFVESADADHRLIFAGLWYMAVQAAREIALVKGSLAADVTVYDGYLSDVEAEFAGSAHWVANTGYRHSANVDPVCERANAILALAGLVSTAREADVGTLMWDASDPGAYQCHGGVWLEKWVIEALVSLGFPARAHARILRRFVTDHGLAADWRRTLPEQWHGTDNGATAQGWGIFPVATFGRFFAGVSPMEAGYDKYCVCPAPGDLTSFNCVVPTKKGDITSNYAYLGPEHLFTFTVLGESTCRLGIPRDTTPVNEVVTLASVEIYNNGVVSPLPTGVTFVEVTARRIIFEIEGSVYGSGEKSATYENS